MRTLAIVLFLSIATPANAVAPGGGDGGWGPFGGNGGGGSDGFGGTDGGSGGGSGDSGGGLTRDYIRALGEGRTHTGLSLLQDFLTKDRTELSLQRDLGTLCIVNNCRGFDGQTATNILNNAFADSDRSIADKRYIEAKNSEFLTILIAFISLLISISTLIFSQKIVIRRIFAKVSKSGPWEQQKASPSKEETK